MIPIVPALIPHDEHDAITTLQQLTFSPEVHLDVVDGEFAGKASWPCQPVGSPRAVQQYTDQFSLEVDLMTVRPIEAAKEWIAAGADMCVLHVETITLSDFRQFASEAAVSIGVSAHGATSIETLFRYAEFADYIQLMGIAEIGVQGQPFDEQVVEKIAAVRKVYPHKAVSVDGSVNAETIARLKDAGANRFVVGSAITLTTNPAQAYKNMHALIN